MITTQTLKELNNLKLVDESSDARGNLRIVADFLLMCEGEGLSSVQIGTLDALCKLVNDANLVFEEMEGRFDAMRHLDKHPTSDSVNVIVVSPDLEACVSGVLESGGAYIEDDTDEDSPTTV